MGYRLFVFLTLVLQLAFLPIAQASTCAKRYEEFNRSIENGYLTPADHAKIERILNNSSLVSKEQASQVFSVVSEARFRKLSPDDAEAVRDVLRKAEADYTSYEVNGMYNRATKQLKVQLPPRLKGTAIEFWILTHELEHATLHQAVHNGRPITPSVREIFDEAENFASEQFHMEKGAMIAEWQYLNAFPAKYREQLVRLVERDARIDPFHRALVTFALGAADKNTAEEYLALQWSRGRYSRESLEEQEAQFRRTGRVLTGGIAGSALVVSSVVVASCYRAIHKAETSAADSHICSIVLKQLENSLKAK